MPEVLKPAACGSFIKKPRYPTIFKYSLLHITIDYNPKQSIFLPYTRREGTGIAKFKRGRWSATDESPQRSRSPVTPTQEQHIHIFD
jgi:hypothetical protein